MSTTREMIYHDKNPANLFLNTRLNTVNISNSRFVRRTRGKYPRKKHNIFLQWPGHDIRPRIEYKQINNNVTRTYVASWNSHRIEWESAKLKNSLRQTSVVISSWYVEIVVERPTFWVVVGVAWWCVSPVPAGKLARYFVCEQREKMFPIFHNLH